MSSGTALQGPQAWLVAAGWNFRLSESLAASQPFHILAALQEGNCFPFVRVSKGVVERAGVCDHRLALRRLSQVAGGLCLSGLVCPVCCHAREPLLVLAFREHPSLSQETHPPMSASDAPSSVQLALILTFRPSASWQVVSATASLLLPGALRPALHSLISGLSVLGGYSVSCPGVVRCPGVSAYCVG